jgi:uncharacterized protein YlxW (UPF0749 family)
LFAVSALNSQGNDLRPGRYTDLSGLVAEQSRDVQNLRSRVSALDAEVRALTDSVEDADVEAIQKRSDSLRGPAGLEAVSGPGISIELADAPADVIDSSSQDLNLLIVHQQDIQAVVNALWRAGAAGVTVQNQRIVSTTGIKCEGNAVQLDGVPYAQPYVIEAVGDQAVMRAAIDADPYLRTYREQADRPDIDVGWKMTEPAALTLAAYDGLRDLRYATIDDP